MPLYSGATAPTGYTFDSWGWAPRNDWVQVPYNGQMAWGISGETYNPTGETIGDPSTLFPTADAAWAQYGHTRPTPSPGVNQSENAYDASLTAQGISPSELPMQSSGQEATLRVLMQHGLPIPQYYATWAAQNGVDLSGYHPTGQQPAAPPGGNQTPGWIDPWMSNLGLGTVSASPSGLGADTQPNVFLNTISNRAKTQQQIDAARTMMRQSLLKYVSGG